MQALLPTIDIFWQLAWMFVALWWRLKKAATPFEKTFWTWATIAQFLYFVFKLWYQTKVWPFS